MTATDPTNDMPFRPEDLLRPDAYPHAVDRLEMRETHISWVILTGAWAYKLKKSVKFDFIDTSTLDRRRFLCDEELRLNRRLAPELYRDVVPIVRRQGKLFVGGTDFAVEYAVRMRQFPATDELLAQLQTGHVSVDDVTNLAERIAELHSRAGVGRSPRATEGNKQVEKWVLGNLAALAANRETVSSLRFEPLSAWTKESLHLLSPLLDARVRTGHIRECHGDLHAGNIVRFAGRLVPFDCLEFNPELRWIDVIDDIAFLFMDFINHRRADLAYSLLSRYFEGGGDYEGARLLSFYAVYRALVRAKVDALAAEQSLARAASWRTRMQSRIDTAEAFTQPNKALALVLMHGVSGSGKSWLSERLVATLPAVRIRSDIERKRLAEMWPEGNAIHGLYTMEFNRLVYARALDCAEHCLNGGFTTIVDATFLNSADFEPFRALAERMSIPCVIVSCHAGIDVLAARLVKRGERKADASDADLSVLRTQLAKLQPFNAEMRSCVVDIDTAADNAVESAVAAIQAKTTSRF